MNSKEKTVLVFLTVTLLVGAGVGAYNKVRVAKQRENSPISVQHQADTAQAAVLPLDLNKAQRHELEALPGIGPELARRIVAYRERAGRFRRADELLKVPGIGPKRYAALRELVTAGAQSPDFEPEATDPQPE